MQRSTLILMTGALMLAACSTDKSSNDPAPAPSVQPAPSPVQPVATQDLPAPVAPPPTAVTPDPPVAPADPAPVAAPAPGILSIVSINGLAADGSGVADVNPGDEVTLVADVVAPSPGCESLACAQRENVGLDQFTWSADDRANDLCQVSSPETCARSSSFSIVGDAVAFRTPRAWSGDITLTVRQATTGFSATLILHSAQQGQSGGNRGTIRGGGQGSGDGRRAGGNGNDPGNGRGVSGRG